MSRDTWMSAKIKIIPTEEQIRKILEQGTAHNLTYYHRKKLISSYNATKVMLHGLTHLDKNPIGKVPIDFDQAPCMIAASGQNQFELCFFRGNGLLTIMFDIYEGAWYKANDLQNRRGCIDWERYTRLMFALCRDFPIVTLRTYDSYFDEDTEEYQ